MPFFNMRSASSAFAIENIADAATDSTGSVCGSISESGNYFPIMRVDPFPPVSSSSTNSGLSEYPSGLSSAEIDSDDDNGSNAALAALVVLILIPVAIIGVVFALRSKFCRKKLRRVAPK